MNKRIFIAINLPENIKNKLDNISREIQDMFLEQDIVKWVKKDNLHLTLSFLGSIPDEKIPQIFESVRQAFKKPFSLNIKKVCYGPDNKIPPRLIWVELDKTLELMELGNKLSTEKRGFSPHITLGRIRTWQWKTIEPDERPVIEKGLNYSFQVNSIDIMESKLKRTGPEYSILQSIKL